MNLKTITALSLAALLLAACGSRAAPAIPPAKSDVPPVETQKTDD